MLIKPPLKLIFFLFSFIITFSFLIFAMSVNNKLTDNDIQAIKSLNLDIYCLSRKNFEDEIECIKEIQRLVINISSLAPLEQKLEAEPILYLERMRGACYDRARFIEKTARYYNLKTRRIFIIIRKQKSFILNILSSGQPSHASTEILTSKGWLGIDSNNKILLLDKNNNPFTFEELIQKLSKFNNEYIYYREKIKKSSFLRKIKLHQNYRRNSIYNFDIIYGLYSRHGMFHFPRIPIIEINLREFSYNFK